MFLPLLRRQSFHQMLVYDSPWDKHEVICGGYESERKLESHFLEVEGKPHYKHISLVFLED